MAEVSGRQSIGQRDNQQDRYEIVYDRKDDPDTSILLLIADGMGGHVGGEVAAELAVKTFRHHFTQVSQATRPLQRLRDSLQAANAAIAARVAEDDTLSGMGCTMIGALKRQNRLYWISVGDSVLYLFRDGALRRLNADHSVYGELMELVAEGRMTKADADKNPRRNALRSALVGGTVPLLDDGSIDLEKRDLVILATDGIDTLGEDDLARLLADENRTDVRTLTAMTLQAVESRQRPRQDNTSVIIYRHRTVGETSVAGPPLWSSGQSAQRLTRSSVSFVLLVVFASIAIALLVAYFALLRPGDPALPGADDAPAEAESAPAQPGEGVIAPPPGPETTPRVTPDTGSNGTIDGAPRAPDSDALPDSGPDGGLPEDTPQGTPGGPDAPAPEAPDDGAEIPSVTETDG